MKGAGKKAAAGKQDKGGSSAEKEASAGAGGKPDLEKLSKGLPKGWRAMWDKNSKEVYYGNTESKVGSAPHSSTPEPKPPLEVRHNGKADYLIC